MVTAADLNGLLAVINGIALVMFLMLLGAVLFSMVRRIRFYRVAQEPIPVLLKRGIGLFLAFTIVVAEGLVLRVLGIDLTDDGYELGRLLYTVQADAILVIGLGYYAKTELFDIDDPEKP